MKITVSNLPWAKRHKRKFDGIISIEDASIKNGLRFHNATNTKHLILRFEDNDSKLDIENDKNGLPNRHDVEKAVFFARDFAKDTDNLLIHCYAGISRSTAIALCVLSDHNRHKSPEELLKELYEISPTAVPNLRVLSLYEKIFDKQGFVSSVLAAELSCPEKIEIRKRRSRAGNGIEEKDVKNFLQKTFLQIEQNM
jgi:predicted protein tyrosine phosphatase